jgi:hypothetical protein
VRFVRKVDAIAFVVKKVGAVVRFVRKVDAIACFVRKVGVIACFVRTRSAQQGVLSGTSKILFTQALRSADRR